MEKVNGVNGLTNGHSGKHQHSNGISCHETSLWTNNDRNGKSNFVKQLVELLLDPSKLSQIGNSSSVVQFKQPKELEVSFDLKMKVFSRKVERRKFVEETFSTHNLLFPFPKNWAIKHLPNN